MKSLPLSLPILLLVACLFPQVSMAQVSPTLLRDVAYDHDHASQCLDVYLTKSDTPTPAMIHIHGGGWTLQSKRGSISRAWILEVNVCPIDARYAPRDIQEAAFKKGLVPYIPVDDTKQVDRSHPVNEPPGR